MKRFIVVIAILVIIAPAAQSGGLVSFGLQANGASLNVPEPLKSVYGPGFGGGAHIDLNFIPMFNLRVTGDYISFSADEGKFKSLLETQGVVAGGVASGFAVDGGRINILSFGVNGKLALPTPILSPYATAGVGTATLSSSDANVSYQGQSIGKFVGTKSQTNFSTNIGAGVDVNLAVVTLYLEAKYTWIFTEGQTSTYIPVSLGVTF